MIKLVRTLVWLKAGNRCFFLRGAEGPAEQGFISVLQGWGGSSRARELCGHTGHCHLLVAEHTWWRMVSSRSKLTPGRDRHHRVECLSHPWLSVWYFVFLWTKKDVRTPILSPKHLMKLYYWSWSVFSSLNQSPWIKRQGEGNPGEIYES